MERQTAIKPSQFTRLEPALHVLLLDAARGEGEPFVALERCLEHKSTAPIIEEADAALNHATVSQRVAASMRKLDSVIMAGVSLGPLFAGQDTRQIRTAVDEQQLTVTMTSVSDRWKLAVGVEATDMVPGELEFWAERLRMVLSICGDLPSDSKTNAAANIIDQCLRAVAHERVMLSSQAGLLDKLPRSTLHSLEEVAQGADVAMVVNGQGGLLWGRWPVGILKANAARVIGRVLLEQGRIAVDFSGDPTLGSGSITASYTSLHPVVVYTTAGSGAAIASRMVDAVDGLDATLTGWAYSVVCFVPSCKKRYSPPPSLARAGEPDENGVAVGRDIDTGGSGDVLSDGLEMRIKNPAYWLLLRNAAAQSRHASAEAAQRSPLLTMLRGRTKVKHLIQRSVLDGGAIADIGEWWRFAKGFVAGPRPPRCDVDGWWAEQTI